MIFRSSKAHYLLAVHKCFCCLLLWLWWTDRHVLSFNYTQSDTRIVWATAAQAACRSLYSLPIFCSMTCCRKWKYRWWEKFSTTQRNRRSCFKLPHCVRYQNFVVMNKGMICVRGGSESFKVSFIFDITNNKNLLLAEVDSNSMEVKFDVITVQEGNLCCGIEKVLSRLIRQQTTSCRNHSKISHGDKGKKRFVGRKAETVVKEFGILEISSRCDIKIWNECNNMWMLWDFDMFPCKIPSSWSRFDWQEAFNIKRNFKSSFEKTNQLSILNLSTQRKSFFFQIFFCDKTLNFLTKLQFISFLVSFRKPIISFLLSISRTNFFSMFLKLEKEQNVQRKATARSEREKVFLARNDFPQRFFFVFRCHKELSSRLMDHLALRLRKVFWDIFLLQQCEKRKSFQVVYWAKVLKGCELFMLLQGKVLEQSCLCKIAAVSRVVNRVHDTRVKELLLFTLRLRNLSYQRKVCHKQNPNSHAV